MLRECEAPAESKDRVPVGGDVNVAGNFCSRSFLGELSAQKHSVGSVKLFS
jgi:hypothetical protein